ncbi:hypothetical protein HHK36_016324 [Tetracentron sinense]|uniref:Uncharacterized protein n=1 Tax=Tetracentron sinense TaxID=13715 RepID=A0A835DBD9_TETSI|nr:hypothetical protein HHK36_016324 [Tetracentron sinense]
MAQELDDGEFWLPSKFLTDNDLLIDKRNTSFNDGSLTESEARVFFPCEFPYGVGSYGFSSSLSSPVESVVSSTETESDEEDYMAELTRKMAHSMLEEGIKSAVSVSAFGVENPKTRVLSGSPQSTLCALGSWSGSSRGSPNGPSQVSSPPSTPMNVKDDAWDLLYVAAGQVVRMKMNNDESMYNHGRGLLDPPRKPDPISAPLKDPNVGVFTNQVLTYQQLQNTQFHQLKQQQLMKQQSLGVWGGQTKVTGTVQQHQHQHQHQHQQQLLLPNRARTSGFGNGRCARPVALSSTAWSPQQHHQGGSGMRAVFLGGSGSKKQSCGTGVFLPRRVGNPSEPRKKPACSTVLVPARVVQALNLNFDESGAQPRFGGRFTPGHDALLARSTAILSQQKRNYLPQQAMNHEICLPQEWTY